jgi:hypothetical protein
MYNIEHKFYKGSVFTHWYFFQILVSEIFSYKGAKVGGFLPVSGVFEPVFGAKLHKKDLFLPFLRKGARGMAAFVCRATTTVSKYKDQYLLTKFCFRS